MILSEPVCRAIWQEWRQHRRPGSIELLGPRSNLTIGETYLEAGELGILGNVVPCYTKKGKARQG